MRGPASATSRRLPALRRDPHGTRRVDYRAVFALAAPLFLNSGVQAILNLTDTWFLGRVSTAAMAGVGAVYWFVIVFVLLFGGVSMAVQTLVAQAHGAGERGEAAEAAWAGLWSALSMLPLFVIVALCGTFLLAPFPLAPEVRDAALEFWFPRMLGAAAGVALWTVTSFFNGIGRTSVTLAVMLVVSVSNAVLNQWFAFELGLGVAGVAWATGAAQLIGIGLGLALFLSAGVRRAYGSHLHWRPSAARMGLVVRLGVPMGMLPAADLTGLALFQVMLSGLGAAAGAATQMVMMMTSLAYMPAIGIASAGTTLVGQSIGAGDRDWAAHVGNAAIRINVMYMGLVSLLLALAGPWLLPLFVTAQDAAAAQALESARVLLWIAAAYQVFDGFNLGASFCLRGAGDVRVPTLLVLLLSWLGFVPLTHMLSFAPGEGLVGFLPQFGLGAAGGWAALLLYTGMLGAVMFLRWRSGAWRRIALR
ncbi:MAG: MATE family efflux transporter [Burkholderiales bacterium]|nr:MATE family efflux transporter [Burkholderiales bacterium]